MTDAMDNKQMEFETECHSEVQMPGTDDKRELIRNLLKTVLIYVGHICMGLLAGSGGPSFLDILQITQTNVQQGSIYFTSQYLGTSISGIGGGFLYDHYPAEPIMMSSLMACGILNVIIPYCPMIGLMAVVNFLKGAGMGIVFIGLGSVIQRIWGKEKSPPYQQALHFFFSLGGAIAPEIVKPFLSPRVQESNATVFNESGLSNTTIQRKYTSTTINNDNASEIYKASMTYGPTRVHYGFLIIGVITLISGVSMLGLILSNRRTESQKAAILQQAPTTTTKPITKDCMLSRKLRVVFLSVIIIYYILIVASETLFQNFLMTFVVTHLNWEKSQAVTLMTVFWIAFAFGRLSGIPFSKILTPGRIISVDFCAMLFATLVFTFWSERHEEIVWVSSVVFGIFVASLFAAGVTYIDHYIMRVTGKVYGIIIMSATTGAMINPPILGALMTHFSPVWFSYLALILCILNAINFGVLVFLSAKWGRVGPTGVHPIHDHIFWVKCRRKDNPIFSNHDATNV